MQSDPNANANAASSFGLKMGYYLWLAAIGAVVYAYVFANSPLDAENKDVVNERDSRAPGQTTVNTGNRVLLLLPLAWLYTYVMKLFTRFTYEDLGSNAIFALLSVAMLILSFGTVIGFGTATSYNWTYSLIVFFFSALLAVRENYIVNDGFNLGDIGKNLFSWIGFAAKLMFMLVFPAMMMQYLIKTGTTSWFQIVAGVSIVASSLVLLYNWYAIRNNIEPIKPWTPTAMEPVQTLIATSPLLSYLKYILSNDLNDVAKRVLIFALLCYVAYLMISVYKFKHQLVPCASSSFASCFGAPATWSSTTTPYVNALFHAMGLSVIVNVINFFMKLLPIYPILSILTGEKNNNEDAKTTSWWSKFSLVTLIQMLLFPLYWPLQQFMLHPIAVIVAFIAFAALGLLLYRSSFDLTAFIEGQRGTVIAVFTMLVASLIGFGVYAANSKGATTGTGPTGAGTSSGSAGTSSASAGTNRGAAQEDNTTYGEFIFRPFLILAVIACIVGLLLYFLTSSSRLSQMANLLQYGITALIYIGGIAVLIGLVRTVFSTSRKMGDSMFQVSPDENWVINVLKLTGNALFYLPCLMIDSVEMLKEQYGLTTRPILILLALEAAFILAGHVLPSLVTRAINHTGIQILSAPISMTTSTTINRYKIKFVSANGVSVDETETPLPPSLTPAPTKTSIYPNYVQLYNYRYGVSAWFYIHPQPPSSYRSSEVAVFSFGGDLGPIVSYNPSANSLNVSIAGSDADAIPSITDIPLQRWNNLVINSDKGTIDIFVNGTLIYTGTHIPQIPKSPAGSSVMIGPDPDEKLTEGANGEICNMVLNREPFTRAEIDWFYNTNKMMNPPVVGMNPDPLNQGDSASYLASEAVGTDVPAAPSNPLTFSKSGTVTYGWLGAVLGAIFGWIFNNANTLEATKGFVMGAIVFGLIGALLGGLFSTDGTVANIMKTVANVFVDTF